MAVYLIAFAAAYLLFYLIGIGNFDMPCWDEFIYVNAARSYLEGAKSLPNPEHPPLGKQLIVLGIQWWGDNPAGWRIFSAVSGALSLALVVYLVYRLTHRKGVACFVGALLFLDPLFYVHFRLAILEPPLLFFFLLAVTTALLFYQDKSVSLWKVALMSVCLGLALATKMLTLVLMPVPLALAAWGMFRKRASAGQWAIAVLCVMLLPPLIFVVTYLPLGYGAAEIWEGVRFSFGFHRYYEQASRSVVSRWYEWLYIGRPIWYFLVKSGPDRYLTMLATGNLALWIGAQLLALYALLRQPRRLELWALAGLVLIQFALYAIKPNTFFYYMVMVLPFIYILMGVGLAALFDRYGHKYRRLLQLDMACFFLVALLIFWNYFPYIWGKPISEARFNAVAKRLSPTYGSTSAPSSHEGVVEDQR
jgi:dolichyl-phosphate-mannose--protein O-mannosyl transferase